MAYDCEDRPQEEAAFMVPLMGFWLGRRPLLQFALLLHLGYIICKTCKKSCEYTLMLKSSRGQEFISQQKIHKLSEVPTVEDPECLIPGGDS